MKVLVYTIHKSGSMLLNSILAEIGNFCQTPHFSINTPLLRKPIRNQSWETYIKNGDPGIYGPIRVGEADPCNPTASTSVRLICHIRDPRDVLTSLFYSHAYSHKTRADGFNPSEADRNIWRSDGVDRYVLRYTELFAMRYEYLIEHVLCHDDTLVLRYETMICDYRLWISELIHYLNFSNAENEILYQHLYLKFRDEIGMVEEDVTKHRRQVAPGDYLRKLKHETIKHINCKLQDILIRFGYF